MAADHAFEARPERLFYGLRDFQSQASRPRRGDDRRGDDMMRGLLQGCRQPQHLVGAFAGCSFHGGKPRAARGQRSCLVEKHRVHARQRFEWPAALDENAIARSPRDASDECHGRCQNEGAGRGCNKHGQSPHWVSRHNPSQTCEHERGRQQQEGIFIGHANEGRLCGLRRRDHTDNACIGALARDGASLHFEGFAGIHGAAQHARASAARDRYRLPCQGRFIEYGVWREDDAIGGDDFARPHEEDVPDPHRLNGNIFNGTSVAPMCDPRGPIDERFQVALGTGDSEIFQDITARIHHRDNDRCERRAEGQCSGHREKGDGIDAQAAGHKIANHG